MDLPRYTKCEPVPEFVKPRRRWLIMAGVCVLVLLGLLLFFCIWPNKQVNENTASTSTESIATSPNGSIAEDTEAGRNQAGDVETAEQTDNTASTQPVGGESAGTTVGASKSPPSTAKSSSGKYATAAEANVRCETCLGKARHLADTGRVAEAFLTAMEGWQAAQAFADTDSESKAMADQSMAAMKRYGEQTNQANAERDSRFKRHLVE